MIEDIVDTFNKAMANRRHGYCTFEGNSADRKILAQGIMKMEKLLDPLWEILKPLSDPTIAGTTIPIYQVTALLDGGLTVDQVIEDFPSLSREQILYAKQYADNNPPGPT